MAETTRLLALAQGLTHAAGDDLPSRATSGLSEDADDDMDLVIERVGNDRADCGLTCVGARERVTAFCSGLSKRSGRIVSLLVAIRGELGVADADCALILPVLPKYSLVYLQFLASTEHVSCIRSSH